MEPSIGHRYTLYCFDLFLHGQSSSPSEKAPLTVRQWCEIVRHFLDTHTITDFSLMGYSMGGRFALTLVECFAERIRRVILMAPDGIRSSSWYQFASATVVGNYLLRMTVAYPRPFFMALHWAHRWGWVQKSILKFVEGYMNTREKRWLVYRRWTALRHITPDLSTVIQQVNAQNISVEIYLGQYDKIVKEKQVVELHKKLINSQLHHLSCGHNHLINKVAQHFSEEI